MKETEKFVVSSSNRNHDSVNDNVNVNVNVNVNDSNNDGTRRRRRRRRNHPDDVNSIVAISFAVCVCACCAIHSSMVLSFAAAFSFSSWSLLGPQHQHQHQHQHRHQVPIPPKINGGKVFGMVASTTTEEVAATKTYNNNNNNNNITIHDKYDVLASLFGSPPARDAFFANDFGTNVVHVQRETSHNKIEDLNLPCIDHRDGSMDMRVLFDTSNYIALRKRGSLNYLDKTSTGYEEFCEYVRDSGSAIIPVAEENALMPFRGEVELSLRRQQMILHDNNTGSGTADVDAAYSVGINVYHSGPNAVALTRHCDSYDVLVLHLDGKKEWEIGVFRDGHVIDQKDPGALQAVARWKNFTLVPGDLLYIPKGVFHAATTAEGFDSTTHATIALEY